MQISHHFLCVYSIDFSFQSFDEKVANVSLAFELMMDGGLPQPRSAGTLQQAGAVTSEAYNEGETGVVTVIDLADLLSAPSPGTAGQWTS